MKTWGRGYKRNRVCSIMKAKRREWLQKDRMAKWVKHSKRSRYLVKSIYVGFNLLTLRTGGKACDQGKGLALGRNSSSTATGEDKRRVQIQVSL